MTPAGLPPRLGSRLRAAPLLELCGGLKRGERFLEWCHYRSYIRFEGGLEVSGMVSLQELYRGLKGG